MALIHDKAKTLAKHLLQSDMPLKAEKELLEALDEYALQCFMCEVWRTPEEIDDRGLCSDACRLAAEEYLEVVEKSNGRKTVKCPN